MRVKCPYQRPLLLKLIIRIRWKKGRNREYEERKRKEKEAQKNKVKKKKDKKQRTKKEKTRRKKGGKKQQQGQSCFMGARRKTNICHGNGDSSKSPALFHD